MLVALRLAILNDSEVAGINVVTIASNVFPRLPTLAKRVGGYGCGTSRQRHGTRW